MGGKVCRTMCLAGASILAFAVPAMAQEVPQDGQVASNDGEIVVTARRREETLQDVPLVVNAVTADTIEKLNLRNFQDVTSVVPGLSLTVNANGIGSSSSMRGVNHDVNVSGENGTIQYYFNDAPVASNFVLQAMYDIGQIEVLRGPQGTLRGRATPSGSITIGARKPDLSRPGAAMDVTIGDHSVANAKFALNVPIIADKLAVRVAGMHDFNRGSRVTSLTNSSRPRSETDSLRVSVRAEPVDILKLGFVYEVLDANQTAFDQVQSFGLVEPSFLPSPGTPNFGVIRPEDRLAVENLPRRVHQDFQFYGWNAELALAGQRLIYVGSHLRSKFHAITPTDEGNIFPNEKTVQDSTTLSSTTTHELRLQNSERVAGLFDYVLGYFNSVTPGNYGLTVQTPVQVFPGFVFVNETTIQNGGEPTGDGKIKEESFFGNLTAHLGERTELSGGLRRIKMTSMDGQFSFNGVRRPEMELNYSETKTIYSASLSRRFNDNLMAYAATGSSFRPPVIAIGNFQALGVAYTPVELAHIKLPSETSKSYEIGIKSQWFDRKVVANLTYYHQDYKNYPFRPSGQGIPFVLYQQFGPGAPVPTVGNFNFISAVPVKVDGVEAEFGIRPFAGFSLDANVNYSTSKIGNAKLACADYLTSAGAPGRDGIADVGTPSVGQLLAAYGAEHLAECSGGGQQATFQPKWSGSVRAEYTMPIMNNAEGYVRGLVNWRGSSATDPNNPYDDVGAYALVNAYVGVRAPDGAWELSLYGKNITNVTKMLSAESAPYTGTTTSNPIVGRYSGLTVTPPREFGVNLRFAIGSR